MNAVRSSHYRGMALIEILMVLGMISLIGLITTQMYLSVSRTQIQLIESREVQQRFDLATWQLRSDVWNAASARVDSGVLVLQRRDGTPIEWRAGDELRRSAANQSLQVWNQSGAKLSFQLQKGFVVLREEPTPADPVAGEVAMPMVAASTQGGSQ